MLPLNIFGALAANCTKSFFGLKPWYAYLTPDPKTPCGITFDQTNVLGAHSPIILILLAVVDDLLRIAGVVAVIYVIVGGYTYITSQGAPDKTAEAQKTLINALIGLVITIIAVALVGFIGRSLSS